MDPMTVEEISRVAENRVEAWLAGKQLKTTRYTKAELRSGRMTPDFRVNSNGIEIALCEVKAVLPKPQNPSGNSDSIPNRLTSDIHDAYKKFTDSNPDHVVPNILAFVQFDIASGVDYLEDVYLGHWFMESGAYPFYVKYANGRIKNEKTFIDLFLWFDGDDTHWRFTGEHVQHENTLRRLFGFRERLQSNGI